MGYQTPDKQRIERMAVTISNQMLEISSLIIENEELTEARDAVTTALTITRAQLRQQRSISRALEARNAELLKTIKGLTGGVTDDQEKPTQGS